MFPELLVPSFLCATSSSQHKENLSNQQWHESDLRIPFTFVSLLNVQPMRKELSFQCFSVSLWLKSSCSFFSAKNSVLKIQAAESRYFPKNATQKIQSITFFLLIYFDFLHHTVLFLYQIINFVLNPFLFLWIFFFRLNVSLFSNLCYCLDDSL